MKKKNIFQVSTLKVGATGNMADDIQKKIQKNQRLKMLNVLENKLAEENHNILEFDWLIGYGI